MNQPDKYAGACWNALMEEETKESIAEMYMDGLDERRNLKKQLAQAEADRDALLEALEMCERCITELYPADGYEEEHNAEWYAVNKVLNAARAAIAQATKGAQEEQDGGH